MKSTKLTLILLKMKSTMSHKAFFIHDIRLFSDQPCKEDSS